MQNSECKFLLCHGISNPRIPTEKVNRSLSIAHKPSETILLCRVQQCPPVIPAHWRQRSEVNLGYKQNLWHQTQNKPQPFPQPDLIFLSPIKPPSLEEAPIPTLPGVPGSLSCICHTAESVGPGSKPGLAWVGVKPTLQHTGHGREAKDYCRASTLLKTFCSTTVTGESVTLTWCFPLTVPSLVSGSFQTFPL